jgi:plasmid stability protein
MAKVILLRNVEEDLHRRVKMRAAKEGTSIQALMTKVITEYLDRVGG